MINRIANYSCIIFSKMHSKCRNVEYPRSNGVLRTSVPDEKVSWNVIWNEYSPIVHTAHYITNASWADPDISDPNFKPIWNCLDGKVNRESHEGSYDLKNDRPVNPHGRTGLSGRGRLGRWGPNHACDPIVTKWKRTISGDILKDETTQAPILQFVAIQRRDCQEWAIPGGMVDPGEHISATLRREFLEEALNSLESKNEKAEKMVEDFFCNGQDVYKGYVDDPRNTDNAWMETVAVNYHDDDDAIVGTFPLEAGDDAQNVRWMDLHSGINLYASHRELLSKVVAKLGAHW